MFEKSGVSITVEGKKHLGAAIGTNTFIENYVTNKVSGWVSETERLSQIAESQPHAAYAALTHGLMAIAYIGMASGSPWVVPSCDNNLWFHRQ